MAMMGVQTISAQNANDGYDMTMSIDMSSHEADISPTLYGVFFEEINHAGEGGLYGELLGNRSFEDKQMPEGYRVEGERIIPPVHTNYGTGKPSDCSFRWTKADVPDWTIDNGQMQTTTTNPHFPSAPTTLKVTANEKGAKLTNAGFWGMGIRLEALADYKLRVIVKSKLKEPLSTVSRAMAERLSRLNRKSVLAYYSRTLYLFWSSESQLSLLRIGRVVTKFNLC